MEAGDSVRRTVKLIAKALMAGGVVAFIPTGIAAAQEEALTPEAVQATLDNVWVLIAAVLVIFMQAGFALVEAGLTRAKNVANIFIKNLMDFCVGAIAVLRRRLRDRLRRMTSPDSASSSVATAGSCAGDGVFTYGTLDKFVFFTFQVAFAATAATIVSGAMAERTKFQLVRHLLRRDQRRHLPGRRPLAVGRRLAVPDSTLAVPRLRRQQRSCTWSVASPRPWALRSSDHGSASTTPTASHGRSLGTTSRSRSSAASSCSSAGTASTPARGWRLMP